MNELCIITSDKKKNNGGIQQWTYYIKKLLEEENIKTCLYAYRQDKFDLKILKHKCFILTTWKMFVFVFPLIFFKKYKFFIFVHGDEILHWYSKFFLKFLDRKNVFFIANSHSTAKFMKRVDLIQYPFIETRDINLTDKTNKKIVFGTLSRLVKRKNIVNVLYALQKLKKNLDFIYYIAGDGEEKEKIKDAVKKLNLQENVVLLGKISDKEKENFFKKIDYFLLPSIQMSHSIEGFGIVFIEANMYGVPVLAGNSGGMKEAVKEGVTGVFTDGSIEDIYEKIKVLISLDFDREKIRKHALNYDYKKQKKFLEFLKKKCKGEI